MYIFRNVKLQQRLSLYHDKYTACTQHMPRNWGRVTPVRTHILVSDYVSLLYLSLGCLFVYRNTYLYKCLTPFVLYSAQVNRKWGL